MSGSGSPSPARSACCASTASRGPITPTSTRSAAARRFRARAWRAEHACIKTLVMQNDAKRPLVVLMHGDREVSTKNLARFLGVKTVEPCPPAVADRHSGYQVGGTSPFGTRRRCPCTWSATIAALPRIYVNGGRQGYLVGSPPPT